MHWIYFIHEFHNLSWITEINELFYDILIYWDAPANVIYDGSLMFGEPTNQNAAQKLHVY